MERYPIVLVGREVLAVVVGGGAVGRRRVEGLLAAGVKVRVIDPVCGDWPAEVEVRTEHYRPEHLAGARLVFACTNNPAVNVCVVGDARAAGAMVSRADDPDSGDFTCPAVWRGEHLLVTVSTTGGAPAVAATVRDLLAAAMPKEADAFADAVAELRRRLKAEVADDSRRADLFRRLGSADGLARFRAGGADALAAWLREMMAS